MILLIRVVLVSLIIYLIFRAFSKPGEESEPETQKSEPDKKNGKAKGVPKEIGEYIDYEEIDK